MGEGDVLRALETWVQHASLLRSAYSTMLFPAFKFLQNCVKIPKKKTSAGQGAEALLERPHYLLHLLLRILLPHVPQVDVRVIVGATWKFTPVHPPTLPPVLQAVRTYVRTCVDNLYAHIVPSSTDTVIPDAHMLQRAQWLHRTQWLQQWRQQQDSWQACHDAPPPHSLPLHHLLYRCFHASLLTGHSDPLCLQLYQLGDSFHTNALRCGETTSSDVNFVLVTAPTTVSLFPVSHCENVHSEPAASLPHIYSIWDDSLHLLRQSTADYFDSLCDADALLAAALNALLHCQLLTNLCVTMHTVVRDTCIQLLLPAPQFTLHHSPPLYNYLSRNCLCNLDALTLPHPAPSFNYFHRDTDTLLHLRSVPLHQLVTSFQVPSAVEHLSDLIATTLQDSLRMHVFFCIPQQTTLLQEASVGALEHQRAILYLLHSFTDLCNTLLRSHDLLQSNIMQVVIDTVVHSYLTNAHNSNLLLTANSVINSSARAVVSDPQLEDAIPHTTSVAPTELYTAPPHELYSHTSCSILNFIRHRNSLLLRDTVRGVLATLTHAQQLPCEFGSLTTIYASSPHEILLKSPAKFALHSQLTPPSPPTHPSVRHILNTFLQRLPFSFNPHFPSSPTVLPFTPSTATLDSTTSDASVGASDASALLARLQQLDHPTLLLEVQHIGRFFFVPYLIVHARTHTHTEALVSCQNSMVVSLVVLTTSMRHSITLYRVSNNAIGSSIASLKPYRFLVLAIDCCNLRKVNRVRSSTWLTGPRSGSGRWMGAGPTHHHTLSQPDTYPSVLPYWGIPLSSACI
uniref:Uncharacterized protein n=1 Tax=Lygus hesperus TaxID=30085 RepID=A0A146L599_LYGHE